MQHILLWFGLTYNCYFIMISAKTCHFYKPPRNGVLACLPPHAGQSVPVCQAYCRSDREFAYRPADIYYCSDNGQWNSWPPYRPGSLPWPDCVGRMTYKQYFYDTDISSFPKRSDLLNHTNIYQLSTMEKDK